MLADLKRFKFGLLVQLKLLVVKYHVGIQGSLVLHISSLNSQNGATLSLESLLFLCSKAFIIGFVLQRRPSLSNSLDYLLPLDTFVLWLLNFF